MLLKATERLTNKAVCSQWRTSQNFGQVTDPKEVLSYPSVFWLNEVNPTGHRERKKKKSQTEETMGRQYCITE